MDFLIGGIQEGVLEARVKPVFDGLGFSGIVYHLKSTEKECTELIERGQRVDLMVLSGYQSQGIADRYTEFHKLTLKNPRIPSILLIANSHQGVMEVFANIHPPNLTAYFSGFAMLTRERMDAILRGDILDWSLY
jgi:hypothetical protein